MEVSSTGAVAKVDVAPYSEELAEGTLVGEYRIEKMIGLGGMGIVYGARHPLIGKRAAIKVLNAKYCADHAAVERFVHEAQSVNQIGHANIVDIFAFGTLTDGRSYLVMEWLSGETLQDRIERGPRLSTDEAIAILIPLTRALDAAHAAGVIHRDLKPENIFLIPEEDGVRIKLLDFGIAKLSTSSTSASRTATGMTMGTPLFMSPEQARGMQIDAASDGYSLGILAYSMVCGRTPFEDEASPVEVLHAHINKPPQPPRELDDTIPIELEDVILRLLAKAPAARPPLAEVRHRLKRVAAGSIPGVSFESVTGVGATPGSRYASSASMASVPRRSRWIVPAVIGALALAAVTVVAYRATRPAPAGPAVPMTTAPAPALASGTPSPAPEPAPPSSVVPQPSAIPAAVIAEGTIDLVVSPASARVKIDGDAVAAVRGRARVDLAAGDHSIEVTAPGFRTFSETVTIDPEKVTSLTARLRPRSSRQGPTKPGNVDGIVNPFAPKGKGK
ncbi:MAG: serine/threonine protein kinase [Myxococcales bacterium]|nr:serine/threonine protein kinase [Myxococcales bacterium]